MAGLAGNRDEAGGESGGDRSGADSQDLRAGRSEVSEVSAQRDVAERNRAAARRSGKRDSGKVAAGAARGAAAGGEDRAPAGHHSLSVDAWRSGYGRYHAFAQCMVTRFQTGSGERVHYTFGRPEIAPAGARGHPDDE